MSTFSRLLHSTLRFCQRTPCTLCALPGHTTPGQMESGAVWCWGGEGGGGSLLLLLSQNVVKQCFIGCFPFLLIDHLEELFHPFLMVPACE